MNRSLLAASLALATALSACELCLDEECPNSVVVHSIDEYVSETGGVTRYDSLPRRDGGVGFFVQSPTATVRYRGFHVDAGWVVPNVVASPYVVELNDTFYVTDAGRVDVGTRVLRRPEVGTASESTYLSLDALGLAPWNASDDLQFFSAGAGLYGYAGANLSSPPSPGQTSSSFSVAYGRLDGSDTPLVSSSQGDVLYVAQMRDGVAADASGRPVFACDRAVSMARVMTEVTSGALAQASFTTANQAPVRVQYPGVSWTELVSSAVPGASITSAFTYAEAAPEFTGAAGDLVNCRSLPDAGLGNVDVTLTTVDAFPAAWARRIAGGVSYRVSRTLDGDFAGTWTHGGSSLVTTGLGNATSPGVFPPAGLKVAGQDPLKIDPLSTDRHVTVSWSPSTQGTPPNAYLVIVWQYEVANGRSTLDRVTRWWTNTTSLTLPARHLDEDRLVLITVRALDTAEPRTPWRSVARSSADSLSGPFVVTP